MGMQNIAVRKVKDLQAAAREVMQNLLGRKLAEEEAVTVLAFPPHPAPSARVRAAAFSRLDKVLDTAAENMKHVPDREFHAAVDEALKRVRRRRKA